MHFPLIVPDSSSLIIHLKFDRKCAEPPRFRVHPEGVYGAMRKMDVYIMLQKTILQLCLFWCVDRKFTRVYILARTRVLSSIGNR